MPAKYEAETISFDKIIKPEYRDGQVPFPLFRGSVSSGSEWKVINADVVEALQTLSDGSVNCVVTSPPYYWQRDYGVEGQIGHESTIEEFVSQLRSVFSEVRRVLNKTGVLFLNIGDTFYNAKGQPHGRDEKHRGRQLAREKLRAVDGPGLDLPRKSLIGLPWRVALALQQDGWTLRNRIVWERPSAMPEPSAHDRPWRTSEFIFLFAKSDKYWFDRDGLGDEEDIWELDARPENPGSHFAPYPRELVRKCLSCGCPPDGVVLDPFVGSGTTIIEALSRGNDAMGIDIKKEYCDFVRDRVAKEFKQSEMFNGQLP